jgi:MinD superfamily P-loop ATPase
MLKLFKRTRKLAVEFCDRCRHVCDSACRRNAIVEGERDRVLLPGMRWS